jgi:hypothetical protein
MKFLVIMHEHRDPTTDEPLFWSNTDGWVSLAAASVFSEASFTLPREAWGVLELPNTLFEEFQAIQYAEDAAASALAEDIPF